MSAAPPLVRLLRLRGYPLLRQLQLEEALLRADAGNWLLLNDGAPAPAVVLGISGKPGELVHGEAAAAAGVPLIRRFSGGGTVVVDQNTLFTCLIMAEGAVPGLQLYPRPIMAWTEGLLAPVFSPHGAYALRENDYVLGERKFGGNAQSITKGRWLHHTSLLWDYDPARMALLRQPARAPDYRRGRRHLDFLVPLREVAPSREAVLAGVEAALVLAGFEVRPAAVEEAEAAIERSPLCGTRLLAPEEYLGAGAGA